MRILARTSRRISVEERQCQGDIDENARSTFGSLLCSAQCHLGNDPERETQVYAPTLNRSTADRSGDADRTFQS